MISPTGGSIQSNGNIIAAADLKKLFLIRRGFFKKVVGRIHAVDGVSIEIPKGGTTGLVGESGCGKTTVGRLLLKLMEPDGGRILFEGRDITHLDAKGMKPFRREMQIIFQDPYGSLNPRMTIGEALAEGVGRLGTESRSSKRDRVKKLLEMVGLPGYVSKRYPHEFSGGQRQRIGIARALSVDPALIVCDEPVSALDVSVQAQIINLLNDLQDELGLSYLFISHDLNLVQYISDRVAVMYGGQIMEYAPADNLQNQPVHPYSQGLIAAVPEADPENRKEIPLLGGEATSLRDPPKGCRFQGRCPIVEDRCKAGPIDYYPVGDHVVRCWKVAEA